MKQSLPTPSPRQPWRGLSCAIPLLMIIALATFLRGAGVYRGIPHEVSFHPDAAKQVKALENYLQGRYIWYADSRFFDGYPYFLNHFDEWMLRAIRPVVERTARFVAVPVDHALPSTPTLYAWTMSLRWFYGVMIVVMTGLIAWRLRFPFPATAGAMLLVALSPVNIASAHFATGDMACDLFFVLAVLCTLAHARSGRWPWLFAAGIAAGWTFAGKYNGGLAAFYIASYALLLALRGPRRIARLAGMGLLSGGGFVAGVLIAMPQFTWAFKRTWRDMRRVLEHVTYYRVPDDFLELPPWSRAWIALSQNTGTVLWGLGILSVLAAVAGLALAWPRWRSHRVESANAPTVRLASLRLALFLFPFLVLGFSLASKLRIHVFYFSWIYPSLAIAAMYALSRLRRSAPAWAVALLGLLIIGELGLRTPRELYFWQREDALTASQLHEGDPVLPDTVHHSRRAQDRDAGEFAIRTYLVEPANIATFRNRHHQLRSPDAPAWRQLPVMPLPVIPFDAPNTDWIVFNGPTLPRSDRMIHAPANRPLEVMVVTLEPLEELRLGVQSGSFPAHVRGRFANACIQAKLGANEGRVLPLAPLKPTRVMSDAERTGKTLYHYRLQIQPSPGPVWITLLKSPREEAAFRFYNGDTSVPAADLFSGIDVDRLAELTARIQYRSGDRNHQRLSKGEKLSLWDPDEVLPAGAYRLQLHAIGLASPTRVRLTFDDVSGRGRRLPDIQTIELALGDNPFDIPLQKPFAPFQCTVAVEVLQGEALIGAWSLLPDVPALAAAAQSPEPPAWQRRFVDDPHNLRVLPVDAVFGDWLHIHEVAWPAPLIPGKAQPFHARVSLLRPIRHFEEHDVFLHFCDEEGQMRMAAHLGMRHTAYSPDDPFTLYWTVPHDLPMPPAKVLLGVWHPRSNRNRPPTSYPDHLQPASANRLQLPLE